MAYLPLLPCAMDSVDHLNEPGRSGAFQSTQWTLIQAAGSGDSHGARALERLCQAYWMPLFHYTQRQGYSAQDAQDLTQGFFERLLRTNALAGMQKEKGRFRSFMLTALKHYLSDERDRSQAIKRGGKQTRISLDELEAGPAPANDRDGRMRDAVFDHQWALSVVREAMKSLASDYVRAERKQWLNALAPLLSREAEPGEYSRLGLELQASEGTVAVAVHRLRRRYRECIRSEVARTLTNAEDLNEEMDYLFRALAPREA